MNDDLVAQECVFGAALNHIEPYNIELVRWMINSVEDFFYFVEINDEGLKEKIYVEWDVKPDDIVDPGEKF